MMVFRIVMRSQRELKVVPTGEATGYIPVGNGGVSPVTVIGTRSIRESFDSGCLRQAVTSRLAPGVTDVV